MKRILTLFALAVAIGFSQNQHATIHVYRLKSVFASALKPSIYVDGKALERLHNGRYLTAEIPKGKHMITAGRTEVGQFIDFEAGKDYYFRLGHRNVWGTAVSGREPMMLDEVTADVAEKETKGLKHN